MTQATFANTRTEICGHSIAELADRFGTPFYVYDADTIRERISQLRMFDVIRYAQKANSNLSILKLMREEGVLLDAVSAGEILRAEAAGFETTGDPHPVVYTADIFDREAIEMVANKKIHCNLGSPDMIDQIAERVPGSEITLRINPGFGHGHTQKTNTGGPQSKHGIWHEQLEDCLQRVDHHGLQVTGLHMHIGSGTDFEHLSQVCDAMKSAVRSVGRSVKNVSAGGGLPTPYQPGDQHLDIPRYFELWDAARNELQEELGHAIQLEIEPGRFLAAEAGYLVCEIRAIKKMGDNLFYLVDAGFNNLARPIMYGSYHPISISHRNPSAGDSTQQVIVGGPLCESGDIFTQEEGGFVQARELPKASIGDHLVIECAGAYGYVMASNYNSKPMSAEVLIDGGEAKLARKRQSLDSIFADEMVD